MKSYTDITQSKKLAEILPIESADTWYWEWPTAPKYNNYEHPMFHKGDDIVNVPCWSLAALLEVLPDEIIDDNGDKIPIDIRKYDSKYLIAYRNDLKWSDTISTDEYENLVDACYEMILKFKEKDLL